MNFVHKRYKMWTTPPLLAIDGNLYFFSQYHELKAVLDAMHQGTGYSKLVKQSNLFVETSLRTDANAFAVLEPTSSEDLY